MKNSVLVILSLMIWLIVPTSVTADAGSAQYIVGFNLKRLETFLDSNKINVAAGSARAELLASILSTDLSDQIANQNSGPQSTNLYSLQAVTEIALSNRHLLVVKGNDAQLNTLSSSALGANNQADSILSAVDYIEADSPRSIEATSPNDSEYNSYYHPQLRDAAQLMKLPEAWDITTGASSVVVAVIDTGIDYRHPDLAANMWINSGEIAGNSLDDDGNGYIDDVYGFNSYSNNGNPLDDHGHGTHVAGTIGAVGNNNLGVTGAAWNVKLMALKFLGSNGSGSTAGAIAAINYVTVMRKRGVNVRLSNNSWGGGGYSQGLVDAISAANAAEIMFLAATGNNGRNTDLTPHFPGSYQELPNLLSVAAVNLAGDLASFSNYGAVTAHVAASGVDILSTFRNNQYGFMSGTSMATPQVSGVAALLFAINPALTSAKTIQIIRESATPKSSLSGKITSGGYLDAFAAVQRAQSEGAAVYTLSGRVTLNGLPVQGVSITGALNGTAATAATDADGRFSIANVISGASYALTLTKSGYNFSPALISGAVNQDTSRAVAAALVTYTLSGKVSDTNGNALAGVLVAGVINGESSTTTTNSAGDYAFSNILPNSSYSVTPTQSNRIFSPASKAGTISVNTSANFSGIVATYTLSGRVVFSNGVGVKGANIVFGSSATESAADGSYSFSGMASGATISLTVSKSGYTFLSATQSISMTSDKTVNLTVSSVANFTVSGTVRNSKKAFLAGTIVIITGVDNQARSAITDRRGTYTVKNVPLGSAAVAIVAAGHQSFSSPLNVISNTKIANFSLELQNFTVRGSVRTKNGEKVAGLTIRVSGVASAPLVTDSEGAFAIQVPRGTRITLSAAKKRCSFKPGTLRATVLGQDLALAPIVASCK